MSTITIELPQPVHVRPEWRRLCHVYTADSQRSVCGTAWRKPEQDHSYAECIERGHTICVVCSEVYGLAAVQ